MESKKDIGKLFRENLEQLDFAPSAKVWEEIELDLEKKKKKRRFFIWFFFATIMTMGLIGGLTYTFYNGNPVLQKERQENNVSNEKTHKGNTTEIANEKATDKAVADAGTEKESEARPLNPLELKANRTELNTNTTKSNKKKSNANETKAGKQNNKRTVGNELMGKTLKRTNNAKPHYNSDNEAIAYRKKAKGKKTTGLLVTNSADRQNKKTGKSITGSQDENTKEAVVTNAAPSNTTKAIEEIAKQTPVDSLMATTDKKTTKKDRKEKDSLGVKDTITEEKKKEFEIVIAPYYGINYGSYFGEFDALSNNTILENKAASRNTFGIMVRWMFGNRLGIQLGAGKINSRYFSTVDKTGSSFINTQNVATDMSIDEINGHFVNETKVKFTYESSYVEVPLEAYYIIRDKKFGVAGSLGVSLLFAGKNSVFAESENVPKMKIGKLETATPGNVTANAKLYLFYKITPSLQLDLYPAFQYQIMGSTDSGYSGYFFSVRTGLSYKL